MATENAVVPVKYAVGMRVLFEKGYDKIEGSILAVVSTASTRFGAPERESFYKIDYSSWRPSGLS